MEETKKKKKFAMDNGISAKGMAKDGKREGEKIKK